MTNPELAPDMPDYELMLLIETAKKYDRRECFADSGNGFSASIEYSNMLKTLQTRADLAPQKSGGNMTDPKKLREALDAMERRYECSDEWVDADLVIGHDNAEFIRSLLTAALTGDGEQPPQTVAMDVHAAMRVLWDAGYKIHGDFGWVQDRKPETDALLTRHEGA